MNIIDRARGFVQSLQDLRQRTAWEWRRCPHCSLPGAIKYGSYHRHPWRLHGRVDVRVQRYRCPHCGKTYPQSAPWLAAGTWYAREVHRYTVDLWVQVRTSYRRAAEWVRSGVGQQERWRLWYVADPAPASRAPCKLSASTVYRWTDQAGQQAQRTVPEHLAAVPCSGQMGTDGLWGRWRAGMGVLLGLVDSTTGVIWGIVVATEEQSSAAWQALFQRAQQIGLVLEGLNGLTSDGAQGLLGYLHEALTWVHQQRCVWHLWRSLGGVIAHAAAQATKGLSKKAGQAIRQQVQDDLKGLLHTILDAPTYEQGEQALAALRAHAWGAEVAPKVEEWLDQALVWLMAEHQGLVRCGPEWLWRDLRLRLSHGRNAGSMERLERAGLLWMVYRNLTPAQQRKEQKRRYKHPGQSPLEVATGAPIEISYLDALEV